MTYQEEVPTPEEQETQSWGARIARVMAATGFAAKNSLNPSHVEFAKMYADPEGRTARVTALIAKGLSGVEPSRLEAFVLTVQVHLPATLEAAENAPAFLRKDLVALVSALGGVDEAPRRDVIAIDCAACKKHTPDFMVDRQSGQPLCPDCFRKR